MISILTPDQFKNVKKILAYLNQELLHNGLGVSGGKYFRVITRVLRPSAARPCWASFDQAGIA
jgi:hypothetical protein